MRRSQGLVIAGDSDRTTAAKRAWVTRRERYGDNGFTDDGVERQRQSIARLSVVQRTQTHCKRGHAFTQANTYVFRRANGSTSRICRACVAERQRGRPTWIERHGVRISLLAHDQFYLRELRRLTEAMIAAHPDKGGTSRKFIDARKAIERFKATEATWYAAYGVSAPSTKRQQEAKAA